MRLPAILRHFLVALPFLTTGSFAAETPPPSAPAPSHAIEKPAAWFARIGTNTITADEYQTAVRSAYRSKFYHGQPPEAEIAALWRNVGLEIIDRVLLVDEARRRGIKPDTKDVQAQIDAYEKRYASSPNWPTMREQALPPLRKFLEEKSLPKQVEDEVRRVGEPPAESVRQYYEGHKQLFTEPEKLRLSVILFRVDPSSAKEVWDAAMVEGEKTYAELKSGADFAQMAKLKSNDPSAARGGDLGYTHGGMLPDAFETKIKELQPGMLSTPLRTLEGVVIYRLEDRIAPVLQPFTAVAGRAADLLKRENSDKAWQDFMVALRGNAKVDIAPEFQKVMTAPPAGDKPATTADKHQ